MRTLLKIYAASCVAVLAFFLFFSLPVRLLPFSDAVNLIVAGLIVSAIPSLYVGYSIHREGFDFGWLLSNRGGFWVILIGAFGIAAIACGSLLHFWPDIFVPAFEHGALPFGILLVWLYWLALIYMFAFLTFGTASRSTSLICRFRFYDALIYFILTVICLGMSAVLFSLFLDVINDIAFKVSEQARWNAIWIFVTLVIAAGAVRGLFERNKMEA